jgi:hypothetical protein
VGDIKYESINEFLFFSPPFPLLLFFPQRQKNRRKCEKKKKRERE